MIMLRTMLAPLLAAALLASGLFVQANTHENDNCAAEGADGDNDGTDCAFVFVEGVHVKGLSRNGEASCQTDDATMPGFCDADPGSGAIPGIGGAFFVDGDGSPWAPGNKDLDVWVKVDSTFC